MASSSTKNLVCFIHIGGKFVRNEAGALTYIGGIVRSRIIKEGLSYEEMKTMVASIIGKDSNDVVLKFTLIFDTSTFVDLVDDEGVEHLIKLNGESGHVYVEENVDESTSRVRENPQQELLLDNLSEGREVISVTRGNQDSQDSHSLDCAVQMVPIRRSEMSSTKWKDLIFGEGQMFANAIALRETLYKYSIAHNFAYKYVKNNRQKIIVKCKVEGCPWYLGAYSMGERQDTEFLTIRKMTSEHHHDAQDNLVVPHAKLSSLTSSIVVDSLRNNIDKSSNDIIRDMYREYGVRLNYFQAYRAKQLALRQIHGNADDSYTAIPWICDRLVEIDAETVARCEFSSSNRFERVFISYGCSIRGFLQGCRAILYIDGCHLSGPYKGTMVSANAYDADDQLFPLAYAIVSGETHDEWSWFLGILKEIIGTRELTIVSDRNPGIISSVREVFGGERHAFCYRHVKENFSAEYVKLNKGKGRTSGNKKESVLKMLDAIAYARHEHEYNVALGRLKSFSLPLGQWVETQGDVQRWAQSKFQHRRWDKITTNVAESFNAWVVKERKHNVDVFIQEHREKLAKKLVACKDAMKNWKNGVGPNIESKLMEEVRHAENMDAINYGDGQFAVRTVANNRVIDLRVDLGSKKCTCLAWQMSGLPCAHACAAIKCIHASVYSYVEECYKLAAQEKIYATLMIPVPTHDMPRAEELTVTQMMTQTFLRPPITRRPPGRPKRARIESQFQDKREYHCGRCNEAGHSARTCKNPNPS